MLASWSSRVTTTSSPGPQLLREARAKSKVSWVMRAAEDDAAGVGAEQVGHRGPGAERDVLGAALGLGDGAAVGQRRRSGVAATASATASGRLGAAGAVEVGDAGGEGRELGADSVHVVPGAGQRAGHQTNALSPVIARPTISVFISRVPS